MENELISSVFAFVEEKMRDFDPSHDMSHILRVHKMAKFIAENEVGIFLIYIFEFQIK